MSRNTAPPTASALGTFGARFVLGEDGRPQLSVGPDGEKDYKIELYFRPNPGVEAESVTFYLDEETYGDPIRLAYPGPEFTSWITSYGDFELKTQVEIDLDFIPFTARLSDLLRRGHPDAATNPAIAAAIADIVNH